MEKMTVLLKAKEEADKQHTSQSNNQIWQPADEFIPNSNLQWDTNDQINLGSPTAEGYEGCCHANWGKVRNIQQKLYENPS